MINIDILLSKYKKEGKLTKRDKLAIFKHVYEPHEDESLNDFITLIGLILYQYGDGGAFSDDESLKIKFLSIYGESRDRILQIKKVDDVLDIFLDELLNRTTLKPIFPNTSQQNNWEPYCKENSLDYLAMKKLGIYSTSSFALDKLISNCPHEEFPMTEEIFEDLTYDDVFENAIKPVMQIINGIYREHWHNKIVIFITWFNSYFWSEDFEKIEFENELVHFKAILPLFLKFSEVKLNVKLKNIDIQQKKVITISGTKVLSELGKEYLVCIAPLNSIPLDQLDLI